MGRPEADGALRDAAGAEERQSGRCMGALGEEGAPGGRVMEKTGAPPKLAGHREAGHLCRSGALDLINKRNRIK